MNWFTHNVIANHTTQQKQELFDADGGCEHVEQDISLAYAVRMERDGFGPVGSCVCCKECDAKADEAEDNEERVCDDCKQTVKQKDGGEWKWYDFYAAQGDTPLFICNCCRKLPKHQHRIAKDSADYNAEFGDNNDYD
jgi:hypothetical protein